MEISCFARLKKIFSYLLVTGIIITTLFCLVGYWKRGIIFELISHFKVLYFTISLILLIFLGIIGKKRIFLVGLFCAVINLIFCLGILIEVVLVNKLLIYEL